MKYKEKRDLCSAGCGRKRRDGQRDCSECHRVAMRAYRKRKRLAAASDLLDRAARHLQQRIMPKMPRGEWKDVMEAKAMLIGLRLKAFNEGAAA